MGSPGSATKTLWVCSVLLCISTRVSAQSDSLVAAPAPAGSAVPPLQSLGPAPPLPSFDEWASAFNKTYPNATVRSARQQIFNDNRQYVAGVLANNSNAPVYLNTFGDITLQEFNSLYHGLRQGPVGGERRLLQSPSAFTHGNVVPYTSVDWIAAGKVNAIKNQGQCGCCWAFSATSAVESLVAIQTGQLFSLSDEQVCDCVLGGCYGSHPEWAYQYMEYHPVTVATAIPYLDGIGTPYNTTATCPSSTGQSRLPHVTIQGYASMPFSSLARNEYIMAKAVTAQPIHVVLDASDRSFQHYGRAGVGPAGGVPYTGSCNARNTDHAVTIVGYISKTQTTSSGSINLVSGGTWLLRNSWSTDWGFEGYFLLPMSMDVGSLGACGIATAPGYPTSANLQSATSPPPAPPRLPPPPPPRLSPPPPPPAQSPPSSTPANGPCLCSLNNGYAPTPSLRGALLATGNCPSEGSSNYGYSNSGSNNVGCFNSGYNNTGNYNSGSNNIGDYNSGSDNVGRYNNAATAG